jgi:hypothetical protein
MRKEFIEGFFKRAEFNNMMPLFGAIAPVMTAAQDIKKSLDSYYSTCLEAGNDPQTCSIEPDDMKVHY